jgi:hypothetical protein
LLDGFFPQCGAQAYPYRTQAAPGDISLLKPGVAVLVIALKHEDGKLTSARLYAEEDGIKPPM